MSEMDINVGRLTDPYQLDGAYAGGQPVGTVEKIVMNEPDPDRLRPYIQRALREGFTVKVSELGTVAARWVNAERTPPESADSSSPLT